MLINYFWANSGQGEIFVTTQANPAAGAQHPLYLLPAGYRYLLVAFTQKLVSGAVVANRYFRLIYNWEGGGVNRTTLLPNQSMTANTGFLWSSAIGFGIGGVSGATKSSNDINSPLPMIVLNGGAQIDANVRGLQAGDQLSNWAASFLRWRLPA